MNYIPTPETNALARGNHVVPTAFAEDLERERAELRSDLEFRRGLFKLQEQQLAAVTEQRDRLAEALERVLEYQGRFAEEDPESIAAEALAAVKGGSDEKAPRD
jgi:hypothetical protein